MLVLICPLNCTYEKKWFLLSVRRPPATFLINWQNLGVEPKTALKINLFQWIIRFRVFCGYLVQLVQKCHEKLKKNRTNIQLPILLKLMLWSCRRGLDFIATKIAFSGFYELFIFMIRWEISWIYSTVWSKGRIYRFRSVPTYSDLDRCSPFTVSKP